MQSLLRNLRYGFRLLIKNPIFTVATVLTLTLGIGANAALFTVTSALLLRPFPYPDGQQLVTISVKDQAKDFGGTLLRYEMLRDATRSFQSIAVWTNDNLNLTGTGEPIQVPVARVSPGFFGTLGLQPRIGRFFNEDEGHPEGKPVVVLSNTIWQTRFDSNRNIVGRTITLDQTPYTVVGVLPANVQFPFMSPAEFWIPRYFEFSLIPTQRLRMGVGYLSIFARLRPDISLPQANAELEILNQRYREQNPTAPDAASSIVMNAESLRDSVVANLRGKLLVLSAAVAVVLLIACANVASLLLSRALARRREMAMRTALGATRGALLFQLLTESVLLALLAGGLGISVAWMATRALVTWGSTQLPHGIPLAFDFRVLLFTLGVSLAAGILFGTVPAMQLARSDPNTALRDEGRGISAGQTRSRAKSLLVVGQVSLSVVLLISAALLLRSFVRLLRVDPGFDAHNVLTMDISLPTVKYAKPEQQIAFFDEFLRRVSTIPGVRSAAVSAALPLSWKRLTPVLAEGQTDVPLPQRPFVDIEAVSPRWFQTLHVPLHAGRSFTEADNAQAPKVVIVNETFARQYWPNQNPIGKHVVVGRWPTPAEVIGEAADIRNKGIDQPTQPQLYLSFPQLPWGDMNLLIRTGVVPQSVISPVRAQIASIDSDQPITNIQTVDELMDNSRSQPRFTMLLLAVFSATALILAVVGIYGVLSYS
ncbi:MAG TPA: ABC transporter permease, partial [Candidatus Sulfotelmatobacter sp.]|nr:ABC transporter permease [Candidatus Sulfotelmatobacter sp.]